MLHAYNVYVLKSVFMTFTSMCYDYIISYLTDAMWHFLMKVVKTSVYKCILYRNDVIA